MQRILPWLALICAVAISVVAVIELDDRADDDRLALDPTIRPSPSARALASPTPDDTEPEETSPARTARRRTPRETTQRTEAAPAPTRATAKETPEPEPEPTPTPEPPATPTPEPAVTAGPIDASGTRTPHTGGSALPSGVALFTVAAGLRTLIELRRRSY